VLCELDSGTDVELNLPVASAYAKPSALRESILSRTSRS
jgi:hypothetical protein